MRLYSSTPGMVLVNPDVTFTDGVTEVDDATYRELASRLTLLGITTTPPKAPRKRAKTPTDEGD